MKDRINKKVIDWLLEKDDPGIRYLALRDLFASGEDEVESAKIAAHRTGPIPEILSRMNPGGYWEQPGPGYYPKYTGSVWSLILLAQLGADINYDARIGAACLYILDSALTVNGQFTINGLPSGTIDCLQGNLCGALWEMGCRDHRLTQAYEWLARSVTGEGVSPMTAKKALLRYYAGKCGPGFVCGANNKLPCAWGAVKVLSAFGKLNPSARTPLIEKALNQTVAFIFSVDPSTALYPSGYALKPSGNWWKFGFPVFYVTDVLQIAEALSELGYASDSRLQATIALIRKKQTAAGYWLMEYDYTGKIAIDPGKKNQANKWVTWRALRVLKSV